MAEPLTDHLRRDSGRTGDCRVGMAQAVQANAGVVGVSNSFAMSGSVSEIWPGCLDAAQWLPTLPVIGNGSGVGRKAIFYW